ncbi:hypothetical protein PUMCH_001747 [Australozyma saopauloensis]|uniref:Zinc finger PHD-type domain-containing protein n=1 Tax=Australozyma saopauloensis TaxID=291208 RepID=A0AAX4H7E0_9ASCO|nr:hypothetical protein PUMCH_001747 [[Candida] saopauloensis]
MSRRSGRSKGLGSEPESKTAKTEPSSETDEQDEVTRCVCGNDELASVNPSLLRFLLHEYHIKVDTGLFIQCEKCLVWQHGYCVGLFTNDDVPDKYYCEECMPEYHLKVTSNTDAGERTLYLPVNEARKALLREMDHKSASDNADKIDTKDAKPSRLRSRRSPTGNAEAPGDGSVSSVSRRQSRKDRRHGDEAFEEDLQRALRESAKAASGGKRLGDSEQVSEEKRFHSEDLGVDVDESNIEEDTEPKAPKREPKPRAKARPRPKSRNGKATGLAASGSASNGNANISKEELLNQPSKPRFVNDKSSIYELRKRTGAILEWLGRTQMELEQEKDLKTAQFKEARIEGMPWVSPFDENLKLMESLTEKILLWEQKFGKYAP